MYPSKKGLALFIGILGIISMIIGGVLVFLTADFIPWPECPRYILRRSGDRLLAQSFQRKFSLPGAGDVGNELVWFCDFGEHFALQASEAASQNLYLGYSFPYPEVGKEIQYLLQVDFDTGDYQIIKGSFGVASDNRINRYLTKVNLKAMGYPNIHPAVLYSNVVLLPDGNLAIYEYAVFRYT